MKTFEQLAEAAYDAYCKRSVELGFTAWPLQFRELVPSEQALWAAVAKQVAAEIEALH